MEPTPTEIETYWWSSFNREYVAGEYVHSVGGVEDEREDEGDDREEEWVGEVHVGGEDHGGGEVEGRNGEDVGRDQGGSARCHLDSSFTMLGTSPAHDAPCGWEDVQGNRRPDSGSQQGPTVRRCAGDARRRRRSIRANDASQASDRVSD